MALLISTFLWGQKYDLDYVRKLSAGVARHLEEPHRFVLFTDDFYRKDLAGLKDVEVWPIIKDLHLLDVKGCFVRLRLFDPEWQRMIGVKDGDRLASMDLDVVVTGNLFPLFHRPDQFLILQGANSANPCPYNGSVWMVRAGYRPDVWTDFSLEAAAKVPHYEFPDDQAWLAHKLPGAAGWKVGAPSGIYAFQKPGWPNGDELPADARMVVFPGWRDPSKFSHLPWVQEKWAA